MSKILIIGVGGGGRKALIKMKEAGIPDANYIHFNGFDRLEEAKEHNIPHYNLIKMNGEEGISYTENPKVFAELAENVKDQIKEVIEYHFDKEANGLISKDAVAHTEGLYIIDCRGDNHTFKELCRYRKGERIWKYFTGEYEHADGWAIAKPIDYQYISETDTKWNVGLIAPVDGVYIIAYAFQDNAEVHYGSHSSWNVQNDKVNYELRHLTKGQSFVDILIDNPMKGNADWENLKILSYYIVCDYSDFNKIVEEIQELEEKTKRGLFSRIIHFIKGFAK